MQLSNFSLNTLRAFEAAARHLNFSRAAQELCVTPAAVSHQVKALEQHLGRALFRRTTRGLVLTDEGAALAPTVQGAFERLAHTLQALAQDGPRDVLTVGVVSSFACGLLLDHLPAFEARHPRIELRLLANNNLVDLAAARLDCAIQFGDGAWRSVHATPLCAAPLAPLCAPQIAARLRAPAHLAGVTLLRSYRQEWPLWFAAAGLAPMAARGLVFDSSVAMVQAAMAGHGVALAPPSMFSRELRSGALVQPFAVVVHAGSYWLTRQLSSEPSAAFGAFSAWLQALTAPPAGALTPGQMGAAPVG